MSEIKFEIVKEIVSLQKPEGSLYHTEVNVIRWGGNAPKVDIRKWSDGREKCSKGLTLTFEEARTLFHDSEVILNALDG